MEHIFDTYDVNLKCLYCEATKSLYMEHCGFPNGDMLKDIRAFEDKHRDCKKKEAKILTPAPLG